MDPSPSMIGRVIGRYELHLALAAGGMATVHLGRMRSETGLGRTVALKRMHPHFAMDPSFVEMFFDEARLAMRVQHPNIVPTFDVVAADAELLLVMEYVHGESLAGLQHAMRATGERVPPAIASAIVSGALAGLHAAHEARSEDGAPLEIVHRDVSPQNILVGVDGAARLLDFGIAKAAGRVHATEQGLVKGKFAYMAPEQLTGGDVDRRADVFAAAVVLWETLTGQRLFRGDTPGALVHAVLSADIPSPRSVVPDLPSAVDEVVMRGLARQKRERFGTARDMAAALEAALPPATPRTVGEWVEDRAAPALLERAALVKNVEGSGGAPSALEVQVPTRMEAVSGRDELPSHAFGEEAGPQPTAPPTRWRRWAMPIATTIVLLAASGSIAARRAIPPLHAAPPSSPTQEPSPPSASATPPASASAPEPSTSTSSAPSASSAPSPLATPPQHRPRPAIQKPNCANPFVVDSRGIRVPRPECF